MRKLLLLVLCLLLPAAALAQPEHAPYDYELSLRYRNLNSDTRCLFDLMYDAIWEGRGSVTLPAGTRYDAMTEIHTLIVREAPELCAADPSWSISYYENRPQEATGVTLSYRLPVNTQEALVREARAIVAANGADEGDYVRELILHDYLCERTLYDLDAPDAHSAYGALMEARAVCDGYSGAYALLLRLAGIPCSVINGQALDSAGQWGSHSWNLVELCGTPMLVDVTWDDQKQGLLHWYFNLPEEWLAADHIPEDMAGLPHCVSAAWNWHVMNGCFVYAGQGQTAIQAALRGIAREGRSADLRFEDAEEYTAATSDFDAVWDEYNRTAAPGDRVYGSLGWRFSDQQHCLLLEPAT